MNDIVWLTMRRMRSPLILLILVYTLSVFGMIMIPGGIDGRYSRFVQPLDLLHEKLLRRITQVLTIEQVAGNKNGVPLPPYCHIEASHQGHPRVITQPFSGIGILA